MTKDLFLSAVVCPARAWWDSRDPITTPLSRGDRFRMEEGQRMHGVARSLYPGGVRITTLHPDVAARLTRDLVNDPETTVLFEAAFKADGYVARADLLIANNGDGTTFHSTAPDAGGDPSGRTPHRTRFSERTPTDAQLLAYSEGIDASEAARKPSTWTIVEVKSGTNPAKYIDDVAYTTLVARRSGLRVGRAVLLTVNPDYTRGMPHPDLFVETDVTDAVDEIVDKCDNCWDHVAAVMRSPRPPEEQWSQACRGCPYFDTRCWGRGIDYPVIELPGIREPRWRAIVQDGAYGVRGITDAMLERAGDMGRRWYRVRESVRTGRTWVSDGLPAALGAVEWPLHFLDFETVFTALPLYPDVHPWEQVPTQYSVHVVSAPDVLECVGGDARAARRIDGIVHSEFIAPDPARDCRRELVQALLHDLGQSGSVVMYSDFEERILRGLATTYPDLADDIERVIARLVDLCAIIREHVYHPDFHGSYSIKTVLPALVPDLSYDGFTIANGGDAAAAFAEMVRGRMELREWDHTRRHLLEYCRLDTWAMVRLWATLSDPQ